MWLTEEEQKFIEGRRWVFIDKTKIIHSMSKMGKLYCGKKYDNYRDPRFLEDYEMCKQCVSGFPKNMQELMNKKSVGAREWAMKNDKDLPQEIFDFKINKLADKVESDLI